MRKFGKLSEQMDMLLPELPHKMEAEWAAFAALLAKQQAKQDERHRRDFQDFEIFPMRGEVQILTPFPYWGLPLDWQYDENWDSQEDEPLRKSSTPQSQRPAPPPAIC